MVAISYFYPNKLGIEQDYTLFESVDKAFFKECQTATYNWSYLLTDILPDSQNKLYHEKYERLSPIVIAYNRGKMIFKGNTFSDNIGWTGGAINIESPSVEHLTDDHFLTSGADIRPFVFISENTFERNMAY
jgi:hypothetical protein